MSTGNLATVFDSMKSAFITIVTALSTVVLCGAQNPVFTFSFEKSQSNDKSVPSVLIGKIGSEPGPVGVAGTFNGSSAVEVPHMAAFDSANFSIAAWASPQQEKCSGRILEKGASNSFWLTFYSGRARFGFWNPEDGYQEVDSNTKFKANEWHQVTGTYDGSTLRLYVDGKLETMRKTSGSPSFNKQPMVIGAKLNGIAGDVFLGALDEVSFYNRVLSEGEIVSLFEAGS